MKDQETYLKLLRQLYADLNVLYTTDSDSAYKRGEKNEIINQFKRNIHVTYDSLFLTPYFRSIENLSINNAFLAIRMTYTLDLATLDSLRNVLGGQLSDVLRYVKTLKGSKNPKKEISVEINRKMNKEYISR
jgi:predicted aminopeptidase